MIIELILFSLFGIAVGVIMGLLPGLHLNNVMLLMSSLIVFFPNPYYLTVFIISAAISQVFTSFIPSIYLGAPDTDNVLSVLPGHRLLLEGRGYEAIKLTVIGGLAALVISIAFVLLFGSFFAQIYDLTRPYIHFALIGILALMILSEKKAKQMLAAILIIALSGLLGIFALNSSLVPQQNVLFPILTGLFAISTLLISINEKAKIPLQQLDSDVKESKSNVTKAIAFGLIAGVLVGLLPAIGVSQAATFMQYIGGLGEARTFLLTLSGINTANEVISLNSLYLINNPRSGASVAIERILPELNFYDMLLFVGVILLAAGIVVPTTLFLGKKIPPLLMIVNYTKLSLTIITFLTLMIAFLTGPFGLLIGLTSTAIGLLSVYLRVNRSTSMSVLIIPSILFFTGLNPLILTLLNI